MSLDVPPPNPSLMEDFHSLNTSWWILDTPGTIDEKQGTNLSTDQTTHSTDDWRMDTSTIVCFSILFIGIVTVGLLGNTLVIAVIFCDAKMRRSVTNILISNLAISDLIIMVVGVPEIVMVMMNRGWVLGSAACRCNRFLLVMALYSSVISLLIMCCERFIAIVFPFKVTELCSRQKNLITIAASWITAISCALPVALYNAVIPHGAAVQYCEISLPGPNPVDSYILYKYTEAFLFYFIPLVIQVVLYSIIAKRLFSSNEQLRTRFQTRSSSRYRTASGRSSSEIPTSSTPSPILQNNDRSDITIKARRGVVKMLVSCVFLYFISYSPIHFRLIFNTFSPSNVGLLSSHEFFLFVIIITHINSAANPIIYGIFSQNFRRQFKRCFRTGFSCRRPLDEIGNHRINSTGFSPSGHGKTTIVSRL